MLPRFRTPDVEAQKRATVDTGHQVLRADNVNDKRRHTNHGTAAIVRRRYNNPCTVSLLYLNPKHLTHKHQFVT